MRSLARLFLALLLALSFVAPALAETSPEAMKWLTEMAGLYEKGPYKMNYDMAMSVNQMGQTFDLEATGRLTQNGRRKMRMDMDMTMKGMEGMQQQGMPAEMKMTSVMVADGTTMWTEMEMPAMPGKQVMKINLDLAEEVAAKQGGVGVGGQSMSMDPMSQIRKAAEIFDFDVTGTADGKVTLEAEINEEGLTKFMQGAPTGTLGDVDGMRIHIVLAEKDGRPVEMRFGGETPIMVLHFNDFEFISEDELPEGIFSYTPPEDARVLDLGQMLGSDAGGS